MSPSTNTQYGTAASNKTLAIFPPIPPNSPTSHYLTTSDLDNINIAIKSSNDKYHSDMKAMNDHISDMNGHISAMLEKLTDTSSKTEKQ